MYKYLGNDWKTKNQIIIEAYKDGIKIHERAFRKYVENHNKKFWSHEVDEFIVHGRKGYKLTKNKEEINKSIQDSKKRAMNMLWKWSKTRKALGETDNIKFELEELEII